jgi:hypothetical protein
MTTVRLLRDPRAPLLLVVVAYLAFTLTALALHGGDPGWFVWEGERYAQLEPGGRTGYDGQFILSIAREGWNAIPHLDTPAYRLQRILLPLTVRVAALGQAPAMPWAVLVINFGAIAATTAMLAYWLAGQRLHPGYALAYAFFIGTLMAYSRDLTEPLALCLAAAGALLWCQERRPWALGAWALAALAKETTLLFPIGAGAVMLYRGSIKVAAATAFSALPFVAWQGVLKVRLDALPLVSGPSLELVPLRGILSQLTLEPGRLSAFALVGLPALALFFMGLWLLRHQGVQLAVVWLLLNALFALLMPADVYDHIMHAGRNAAGMVLALVFALPYLRRPLRMLVLVVWTLPTVVWLVPILSWAPWLSEI